MTPEQTKTMETLLDLFNHEGWKIFIEEQDMMQKHLKDNAYMECSTNDDWQMRRGAIGTLDRLLTFEQTTRYVFEQEEDHQDENDGL